MNSVPDYLKVKNRPLIPDDGGSMPTNDPIFQLYLSTLKITIHPTCTCHACSSNRRFFPTWKQVYYPLLKTEL